MIFTGNRYEEQYIFFRVAWENWQEHETYDYILSGTIEEATDRETKVTGNFDFEGYEIPDVNDLVRIYYSFRDDENNFFRKPIATLLVSYAELNLVDTLEGVKANGTLNGTSVLSVLKNSLTGRPYTLKKNSNAVYEAERIAREFGLEVNAEPSSFCLTTDHTFVGGTDYLEIVNWLLSSAGFICFPDEYGIIQMVSENQHNEDVYVFKNDDNSIMLPDVEQKNDWQNTPNVVRLLYNLDDACISSWAKNVSGSRASLESRGTREITYFEEVSDLGQGDKRQSMSNLAVQKLESLSADIEYVTIYHAYVPIRIYDSVKINYSDYEWTGIVDNISIELSPSTECETRIKRILAQDIIIESGAEVLRSE